MDAYPALKLNDTFNGSDVIEPIFSFQNSTLPTSEIHAPLPYFGEYLKIYQDWYFGIHGYLTSIICAFGIIANILNITVLTRKSMISSINVILTGLAVADMLILFSFLPYAYLILIGDGNSKERISYGWTIFILLQSHFMIVTTTISVWLTVTVAIWRFIAVNFPLHSARWCSLGRAKFAVTATYVACIVFWMPIYIGSTVTKTKGTHEEIFYKVSYAEIADRHNGLLKHIIYWFYCVFTRFVPFAALAALSVALIRTLKRSSKLREIIKNRPEKNASQDRITKTIVAVVVLFLLTQFPLGILVFLSIILGKEFKDNVYINLSGTADSLNLINSAANFIVYCTVSKKFRDMFAILYMPNCIKKQEIVPIEKPPETVSTICEQDEYICVHL